MPAEGFVNTTLRTDSYQELKELSWLLSAKLHRKISLSETLFLACRGYRSRLEDDGSDIRAIYGSKS